MLKLLLFFFPFLFCHHFVSGSQTTSLDVIIPPEIKNDSFYDMIYSIAKTEEIKTILEIGSSSGQGSTQAFVAGINQNKNRPTLFCLEISLPRFLALKKYYEDNPLVKCYHASSVAINDFPSEHDVTSFYYKHKTSLNRYPIEQIFGWLKQDIEYLNANNIAQNGISLIKKENHIDNFDVVLIDGSEFTGKAELNYVYGAKFILLDDINAYKNFETFNILSFDKNYTLIEHQPHLRNGYAIFKKKTP